MTAKFEMSTGHRLQADLHGWWCRRCHRFIDVIDIEQAIAPAPCQPLNDIVEVTVTLRPTPPPDR